MKGLGADMSTTATSLIQCTSELQDFCTNIAFDPDSPPFIAVDTEFMRERTYYPILCLIQVADAKQAVAIDPLAPGLDLSPFFELLFRSDILKVFHAGRQDLEIFNHLTGNLPTPIFDTQLAAMVCGFGEAASYESLVKGILKKSIDKTSRFSDWSSRPLRKEQLTYALADVIHLRPLYRWFMKALNKNQRYEWLDKEMVTLLTPQTYTPDPSVLWKRIKSRQVQSLNPQSLGLLKKLSMWREEMAIAKNLPRRHVIKDDLLVELAILKPTETEDLNRLRDPRGKEALTGLPMDRLFEMVQQVQHNPMPKAKEPERLHLSAQEAILLELLKIVLKHCAQKHNVAAKLLATTQDLERLVREAHPDIDALKGWRFELFGKEALAFKAGEKAFAFTNGKLTLCPLG